MADPLKLLREYIISNRPIKENDQYIIFGDTAFAKSAKTNHLVWSKKDEYYTLESLYFFYKKRTLAHTAYVKEAALKNIQVVTRPDRKGLEDYLTKEKLDLNIKPNIDTSAPIPSSVHISRLQTAANNATATSSNDLNHIDGAPDAKRARLEDKDQSRKEQERILQILDGNARMQNSKNEPIRDLSKDLTADKVAALRSKALARKQKNIKSVEDDLDGASASASIGGSVESRRYLDAGHADVTREILTRERQWRTRTAVMESTSKNFGKSILPILQTLKAREEGRLTSANDVSLQRSGGDSLTKTSSGASLVNGANRAGISQQGYNRYDQERFRKEETEGFKIDTMGTYHGITLKSITEGAKPKQQAPQTPAASNGMNSYSASNRNETDIANRPQKRTSRTPIVVIPAVGASLVTMYNVTDLLQDLRYVSTEDKKSQGARRENEVLIQRHKEGNSTIPYRIVDNPLKLTQDEWERVVAVFVQGPAWQFKGWPWNGNPSEIFQKICAFHLKWDDTKIDPNVSKWAVNVIQLSRNKRHLDRASLLTFWDTLGKYIMKNKPYLRH